MKQLINLLKEHKKVDEWAIVINKTHSTELFFIKEDLQMNRAKDVEKITLTVYKNFEENNKKYKGSSSVKLNPTDSLEEMKVKINQAILAASFVRNEYWALPLPTDDSPLKIKSSFAEGNVVETIIEMVQELYEQNHQYDAFINSTEFFINASKIRIINSNGIDVSYDSFRSEIEIITEAKGVTENIELYETLLFSDFDKEFIKESILEQLRYTSLRARAIPLPKIENVPVIIRGKAATQFWGYYLTQASSAQKYDHLHNNNVGDNIQGDDVSGDRVTIDIKPILHNSHRSSNYDADGLFLKEYPLYKDGVIQNIYGSKRFADYFNMKPTGGISNIIVKGGKFPEQILRNTPYLEVISFSAFQMDPMTGYFGGEFRLAIYHDGHKEIPVTQGTVMANVKEAQKEMYFSKETAQSGNVITPRVLKFMNMTIGGGN